MVPVGKGLPHLIALFSFLVTNVKADIGLVFLLLQLTLNLIQPLQCVCVSEKHSYIQ